MRPKKKKRSAEMGAHLAKKNKKRKVFFFRSQVVLFLSLLRTSRFLPAAAAVLSISRLFSSRSFLFLLSLFLLFLPRHKHGLKRSYGYVVQRHRKRVSFPVETSTKKCTDELENPRPLTSPLSPINLFRPPRPLRSLSNFLSLSDISSNPTGALFGAAATAAHYNDVDLFAGLRAILQLLLLPRSDGRGKSSHTSSSSSSSSAPSADVERLTRLVERLALDVAAKTAVSGAGVAVGSGGGGKAQQRDAAATTLAAAALLLCLARSSFLPPAALRRLRAALASFLPASRAALDAAVASLSGSVEALSCKLAAARAHLSRRADDVDAAVERLSARAAETSRLVEGVAEAVAGVDVNVSSLKADVGSAKEGVALLCRVVADLILRGGGGGGGGHGDGGGGVGRRRPQSRATAAALVAELDAFARETSKGLPFGGGRRRVPGFEAAIEKEFEGGEALFDFGGSSGGSRSRSSDEGGGGGGVDSCSSESSGCHSSGGLFICRRATGSAAGLAGDCFK